MLKAWQIPSAKAMYEKLLADEHTKAHIRMKTEKRGDGGLTLSCILEQAVIDLGPNTPYFELVRVRT